MIMKLCVDFVCFLVCGYLVIYVLNVFFNCFMKGFFKRFGGGDVGWKFICRGIKILLIKL